MRYRFWIWIICAVLFHSLAQELEMPDLPWFDQVTKPTALTEEQLCKLTADLRTFLLEKQNPKKLPNIIPDEKLSRVVVITLGGDAWPGRSYYGCGADLRTAFLMAVTLLQKGEATFAEATKILAKETIEDAIRNKKNPPPEWVERQKNPGKWDWVRLNLVQYSRQNPSFSIPHSRIALTSLVGLAFGPNLGFVFLPEQFTGRALITESSHIDSSQVCNILTENYNWIAMRLWMNLNNNPGGFRVCLFENDVYFADATGAFRMYRGHKMERTLPTSEECLSLATRCADAVIRRLNPENGRFRSPFPEWVQTSEKREAPDAQAELAIALCRLSRECKEPRYAEAAALTMAPVIKRILPSPLAPKNSSIVQELERLPEKSSFEPRKISSIHTNALTCLALLELAECKAKLSIDARETAIRLARHIASQSFGEDFYTAVFCEGGKPYTDVEEPYASLDDKGLAILTLLRVDAIAPELKAKERAKGVLDSIIETHIKQAPMESIGCHPWLTEAMTLSEQDDKEYTLNLVKAGYASAASINISPLYPDYFGSLKGRASCTLAAKHSRNLLTLCRWLREHDKPTWSSEQLGNAVQLLSFHRQAMIDRAGASALANPGRYVGFFRDNLENYGFNLPGQAAQIMSLTAAAKELRETDPRAIERIQAKMDAAIRTTDIHPGPLSVDPVLSSKNDVNTKARSLTGETKAEITQGPLQPPTEAKPKEPIKKERGKTKRKKSEKRKK